MDNDKVIACELPELAAGQTRQRIQVFPAPGDYVHPRTGPFTLTADSLHEFAADINTRGDRIPVDRDHAFYKGLPAPAAGWFIPATAEVTAEGVFSEVEWTPSAAEQVRDREYRFISPEFAFGHSEPDGRKVAEPTVAAATITNRPFFKMMAPIAAEDLDLSDALLVADVFGDDVADTLTEIAADAATALIAAAASKGAKARSTFADPGYRKDGEPRYPLDTAEAVVSAWKTINRKDVSSRYAAEEFSRMKARVKRAAKKFGVTIGADTTPGGNMDLTAMAEAAGLAADASEDEVTEAYRKIAADNAALKAKLEAAPGDEQMKTLIASAARGEAAATKLAELERDTAIKGAVEDGRITAAEKPHYESFWAIDPEGTAKLLAEKQPAVPFRALGSESTKVPVMGPDGKPLAALAVDGSTLVADTTPVLIDGVPTPVNEDTAKIHVAAMDILAKRGITAASEDEYVAACIEAGQHVGIELS